jgi:hypothetical protein
MILAIEVSFVDIDTFRKAADVNNAYSIYIREAAKLWDENIETH